MLDLKLAVAQRHIECMGIKTYINDQPSNQDDLQQLEKYLRDGKIRATAYVKNGAIYYNTIG